MSLLDDGVIAKLKPPSIDWAAEVAETDGLFRRHRLTLKLLLESFAKAGGHRATPENVAWVHLWARTMGMLESAESLADTQVYVGLEMLLRPSFELHLHLRAILGPNDSDLDGVPDRMRGYFVWIVDEELERHKVMADPNFLDPVFDPELARDFLRTLGDLRTDWERRFWEVEELSDQEAAFDREKGEAILRNKIDAMERLLDQADVAHWVQRCRSERRWPGQALTLFQVLGDDDRSPYKLLRAYGDEWMYWLYAEGSSILHGSSLQTFLLFDEESIVPRLPKMEGRMDAFDVVLHTCEVAAGMLDTGPLAPWRSSTSDNCGVAASGP